MASVAALIPDFRERIVDVLEGLGISSTYAASTFRKIELLRSQGHAVHPTYNFRVAKGSRQFFFRVLVRNDDQLRRMRTQTTNLLLDIHEQSNGKRRVFDVPQVVDSGKSGALVWDLEDFVSGYHLPAAWERPSRLLPWLGDAPKQVKVFAAIERLQLEITTENWSKQHRSALRFIRWARSSSDLAGLPLDELAALQHKFHHSAGSHEMVVVHPDLWQKNILMRQTKRPVVLDWDEAHMGEPGEMYGRHWILMASEPRWQEEVVTAIGRRNDRFWLSFHAYAWIRAIDQIHHELMTFQGREIADYQALCKVSPKRARAVDQMLKSLRVLSKNIGGPPPKRGEGRRRFQ